MICRQGLARIGGAVLLASHVAAGEHAAPEPSRGSNVIYPGARPRAADVRRVEKELEDVTRLLGQARPPQVRLFLYQHAADVAAATGVYAGGVTLPGLGQIHSTAYRLKHELVHLVAMRLGGDPGPFFQEGLAVALGDGGRHNDGRRVDDVARQVLRGRSISQLIAGFGAADPQEAYPLAGSFVRSLLQRHGNQRVVRFFATASSGRSADVFQRVFGESLESAGAQWRARLAGSRALEPAP